MKRAPRVLLVLAILALSAGILKATLPQTAIGTWRAGANLSQARSHAAAVLLSDGRILITGGDSGAGALNSAEFVNTDGTTASAAAMNVARSQHFAVLLSDGRVLVGGGIPSGGGGTTNSAEIYDPKTDTWTQIGSMTSARANASAALLQDGRVLVAGGDNGGAPSNTIEIFDPSTGNFSFAGTLSSPRTQQAMAELQDGRVLIIGGFDGTNPLASSDIFDPATGNVSAGPNLANARYSHSATTLLDGRVVVIGGAGTGGGDLASAEVFDPTTGSFHAAGATLATAREGHQAFLLPSNNTVLIAGGSSSGQVVGASELFAPQILPADGSWSYSVAPTGTNVMPRAAATGSAMQQDGFLLVAGGNDAAGNPLASTELYAFPTVKTDATDYPPGTTVNISGSGFQPGETVSITLVESPLLDTHGPYTATADNNGNFTDSSFTTDIHDVNVRFYLSVVGTQSSREAMNTFTDKVTVNTSVSSNNNPSVVSQAVQLTATATQNGNNTLVTCGSIQFKDGANNLGSLQGLNGSGQASITTSGLTQGSHSITAVYSDPGNTCGGNTNGTDTALTQKVAGTATKLAFIQEPSNTVAGQMIATVTVEVEDVNGARVNNSTATVNLAIGTNPGSGTLSGTTSVAAVNGTATFSNLSINSVGSGYTLTASSGTLTGTTSSAFDITAGSLDHFAIATISSPQTAGTAFNITITAEDVNNNTVSSFSGNGFKAVLTSTGALVGVPPITTPAFTNGVLANQSVTITNTGVFTITATGSGNNSNITGTSNSFTVNPGAASKLAFLQQPTSTLLNQTISPAVTVQILDANNNLTTSTANVSVALTGNPAGVTLGGTTTVAAVGGVASFGTLSVNKAGTYTLSASSSTLTGATSASFTISNPAPTLTGLNPTSGNLGQTLNIVLSGTNFITGVSTVNFGADITVNTISVNSQTQITSNITIPTTANLGGHSVTVTNAGPGGGTSTSQTFTVNNPATTTTVTSSGSPSTYGQSVTFTASVTSQAGTPTGTVQFVIDGSNFGNPVNLSSGTASMSTTSLAVNGGTAHAVTANYVHTGIFSDSSGTLAGGQIVSQAPLTITANNAAKTYGQTLTFAGTEFKVTSGTVYSGDAINTVTLTSAGAAATANAGAYAIVPSAAQGTGVGNYNINYVNGTLTVSQATPTVSFTGAPPSAYFGSQFSVTATTNSTAVPTISASGSCTISGVLVTITSGIGTCTLQASWSADTNYLSAAVNQYTNAMPQPVTIAISDLKVPYDGNPHAVAPSNVSPAVAYVVSYTGVSPTNYPTSTNAPVNPGTYTVTVTLSDTVDFSYASINTATLIIQQKDPALVLSLHTGTPEPTTYGYRVYFDLSTASGPCPTGQVQFFVDGTSVSTANLPGDCSVVQYSTATLQPGPHSAYATYAGDTYYVSAQSATIQHTVTADGTNVTLAVNNSTVYVGDPITFTATVTPANAVDNSATVPSGTVNFYDNDTVNSIQTLIGSTPLNGTTAALTTSALPYGSHSISATYVSSDGLYTGSSSPVDVEMVNQITPDINWTSPAAIVYGTALSQTQLNATATDQHNGGMPVPGTFTYTPTAGTVLGVGQVNLKAQFTPTDTATYTSNSATVTVNVTPATLTVTADDQSRVYGTSNPNLTFQYSGFVNTEDPAVITTPPTCTTTATTDSSVGGYPISCSGGQAANYTFTYKPGTLTVNPAPLTITANDLTKNYGQALTFNGTEFTTNGIVNNDTVTGVTLASAGAVATANAGTYAITPSAAAGTGLTNYTISYQPGKLTVNPAALTVTADPQMKTYGSADPPLTFKITNGQLFNGDTLIGGLTRVAGENVGKYAIQQGTLAANSNYALTYVGANLCINPAPLNIAADPQTKTYGSADPTLTYKATGFQFTDTAASVLSGALNRAAGETVAGGPYAITQGTLSANTNYTIHFTGASLTITPATLTVTADPQSKVYGSPDPVLTYIVAGLQFKEDASSVLSGLLSRAAGETVLGGPYAINQGTLTSNQNYMIQFAGSTLKITPASATVAPDTASKVYGSADPAFTGTLTGFLQSDNVTANYSRNAGEAVGGSPYTISATLAPAGLLTNYSITYKTADFTITPKPASVTPNPASKTYGSADPVFTGTLSGFLAADGVTATYSRTLGQAVSGSPYTISANLSPTGVLGNYTIAYKNADFTINAAVLTVKANDANMTYGSAVPAFTANYTGFVGNENPSVLSGSPSLTTTATSTSAVGMYPITAAQGSLAAANYTFMFVNGTLNINKATPTVTATGNSCTYSGAACAGSGVATGVLSPPEPLNPVSLSYVGVNGTSYGPSASAPLNAGNYTVTASFGGNSNYNSAASSAAPLTIGQASSSTMVSCPASVPYTGSALMPCSATVTGAGGLSQPIGSINYANNVNAGTATANASYAGDANHTGSNGSMPFTISQASSTVTVTCPASVIYNSAGQTPCTANVTGAGGLNQSLTVSYTSNTNPGTATAKASFGGDANHTGSNGSANFTIQFAKPGMCNNGVASRVILQPVNADGSSVFKAGSTVPTKFVVCDAAGNSVGPNSAFPNSSVVAGYYLVQTVNGTVTNVDESVYSNTPDLNFRWDPSAQQWIFNQATGKSTNLTVAPATYYFQIKLIDGNTIAFNYGLK